MNKLTKIFLTACLGLLLNATAFADQQTTILTQSVKFGNATAALPYIDGNMATDFEKMANDLISSRAKELLKRFGNNGELDYSVTLNRPSVVSVLLRASYDGRTLYDGINVDLTTGKEFAVTDFFVNNDEIRQAFDKDADVLFEEKGVFKRKGKNEAYEDYMPYTELLPYVRIGEAGRLMQIARLTQNAEGKTLRLKPGSLFAMKLDANPSSGYTWILKNTDQISGKVVKVGSSFVMPAATDTRVGTPGTEIIMFAATEAGAYDVSLEYKRPWETMVFKSVRFKLIVQ